MQCKSSTGKTYWETWIWDWTWGIWNSKSRICNQGIWTIRQNKSKKVNLIGKSKWIWLNYNGIFNFTWYRISIFFCLLFLQDAAGQPAGHDDAEINPPSIDIKSGSCEVNVTNDAHTLIGESHQEVILLQEMILDFSRKYDVSCLSATFSPGYNTNSGFCKSANWLLNTGKRRELLSCF